MQKFHRKIKGIKHYFSWCPSKEYLEYYKACIYPERSPSLENTMNTIRAYKAWYLKEHGKEPRLELIFPIITEQQFKAYNEICIQDAPREYYANCKLGEY